MIFYPDIGREIKKSMWVEAYIWEKEEVPEKGKQRNTLPSQVGH